jgi:cell division protein FtsB
VSSSSQRDMQRQLIPGRTPVEEVPAGNWMHSVSARAMGVRRKAATVVLIASSVSLLGYAVFGHDGLVAYQQKQRQAADLHHQILSLQKENERLALHDQRLQNDRDTIEYEAREQMHYTRPGEVIYTLPEAPGASK